MAEVGLERPGVDARRWRVCQRGGALTKKFGTLCPVGTDCCKSDLTCLSALRRFPREERKPRVFPGLGDERREGRTIQFFGGAVEEAKKERQRLLDQIGQSQRTIERSRQIIPRIDEVLATADKK